MHRWVDFIVERLVANKDKTFTSEVKKHMDMLVTQLITFSEPRPLLILVIEVLCCSIFSRSLYQIRGCFVTEDDHSVSIDQ